MTRARLPALLGLVPLLLTASLVLLAGPATAQTAMVTGLVDDLRADQVAVEPGADVPLDEDAVRSAVQSAPVPVYVAAVSRETEERAGGAEQLVLDLGRALGDSEASVLVIAERSGTPPLYFQANNGDVAAQRGIDAGRAIEAALAAGAGGDVTEARVTAVVTDFVDRVSAQARGVGTGTGTGTGTTSAPAGIVPLLAVGAVGVGAYALVRSRRSAKDHGRAMEDARADVESLYGRLGSDVQTLAPGDDDVARQALADAAERYNATGALMAKADTQGEWAAARRTAAEGLAAARVVRERLGLDPGPDVPMPDSPGPQLTRDARVRVGEDEYEGSPAYRPGRPHYYEGGYYGGQHVPGGWYATPFWQSLLLTSVLSGGLGGRRGRVVYGGRGRGGGFGGMGGGGGFGGGTVGGGGWGGGRRRGGGGFGGFGGGGGWGGGGGGRRGGGGGW